MSKKNFILIFIFTALVLGGCGTITDDGWVFKTADPHLSIGFRWATPIPLLPTVTPTIVPEVVPAEEVGEILPDPIPAPPCDLIKGNISSSGEKIYHVVGGAYYDAVKIDESRGERFFCLEVQAIEAGWRESSR